jgi:hypothetical protein
MVAGDRVGTDRLVVAVAGGCNLDADAGDRSVRIRYRC